MNKYLSTNKRKKDRFFPFIQNGHQHGTSMSKETCLFLKTMSDLGTDSSSVRSLPSQREGGVFTAPARRG